MRLSVKLILSLCCWGCLPCSAAAAEPDLRPVKEWIAKQAGVKSLIVDIRQERHLRTVKKPLTSEGRFYFVQGGPFRWQAGEPPRLVAVMNRDEELSMVYPLIKTVEVFSRETMEKEGAGQGIAFLRAGFPASLEAFLERFQILEIRSGDGWDVVEVKPAGEGSSFAVRKLVFSLHQETHQLGSLQVHLRDGSWINNTVTAVKQNPAIPDSQFEVDLTGFQVKRK